MISAIDNQQHRAGRRRPERFRILGEAGNEKKQARG